jgi:hypothetical protein
MNRPRLRWMLNRGQALAACGGNVRDAVKALIVANEFLETEVCELMQAVFRTPNRAEGSKSIPADTRLSRSEEHGRSDVLRCVAFRRQ